MLEHHRNICRLFSNNMFRSSQPFEYCCSIAVQFLTIVFRDMLYLFYLFMVHILLGSLFTGPFGEFKLCFPFGSRAERLPSRAKASPL